MTELPTHAAPSPLDPSVRPRLQPPHRWWRLACASIAAGFLLTGIAVLFACATLGRPRAKAFFEWAGFSVLQWPGSDTLIASDQGPGFSVFIDPDLVALTWRTPVTSEVVTDRKVDLAGFRYRRSDRITGTPPTVGTSLGAKKWPLVTLCAIGAVMSLLPLLRSRRRASHCPCGYDLTGNTSEICPECGAEVWLP